MLKPSVIVKAPQELSDLQRFFFKEFKQPEQKTSPITLPFFNFVCYTVDLLTEYVKSPLDITFNVFVVDLHLRKYTNSIEVYRRFMGFVNSWKQFSQTDEAKLFLSFLRADRNNKRSIKLFLKIRKVLLKNISQKILQQIAISHEDAVTITHTLQIISPEQRKALTKKINEYFITKTVKYSNNTKFNAAIICEYFMVDLNDKSQDADKFCSKSSNNFTQVPKGCDDFIEEFSEQSIDQQELSFSNQSLSHQFQTSKNVISRQNSMSKYPKENNQSMQLLYQSQSKKPLVNLQKCMKQLFILKEKDLEIDNRFKKINKVREDVDQY